MIKPALFQWLVAVIFLVWLIDWLLFIFVNTLHVPHSFVVSAPFVTINSDSWTFAFYCMCRGHGLQRKKSSLPDMSAASEKLPPSSSTSSPQQQQPKRATSSQQLHRNNSVARSSSKLNSPQGPPQQRGANSTQIHPLWGLPCCLHLHNAPSIIVFAFPILCWFCFCFCIRDVIDMVYLWQHVFVPRYLVCVCVLTVCGFVFNESSRFSFSFLSSNALDELTTIWTTVDLVTLK